MDEAALYDLRFVEALFVWRCQALARLYGSPRRPHPLREALLIRVMRRYYEGADERRIYYQHEMAALGARSTVLRLLGDLEATGLIENREGVIAPTQRLIEWFDWYLSHIREMGVAHALKRP